MSTKIKIKNSAPKSKPKIKLVINEARFDWDRFDRWEKNRQSPVFSDEEDDTNVAKLINAKDGAFVFQLVPPYQEIEKISIAVHGLAGSTEEHLSNVGVRFEPNVNFKLTDALEVKIDRDWAASDSKTQEDALRVIKDAIMDIIGYSVSIPAKGATVMREQLHKKINETIAKKYQSENENMTANRINDALARMFIEYLWIQDKELDDVRGFNAFIEDEVDQHTRAFIKQMFEIMFKHVAVRDR